MRADQGILTSQDAANAMSRVDRKLFVPDSNYAYNDAPQVIGKLSQPESSTSCVTCPCGGLHCRTMTFGFLSHCHYEEGMRVLISRFSMDDLGESISFERRQEALRSILRSEDWLSIGGFDLYGVSHLSTSLPSLLISYLGGSF